MKYDRLYVLNLCEPDESRAAQLKTDEALRRAFPKFVIDKRPDRKAPATASRYREDHSLGEVCIMNDLNEIEIFLKASRPLTRAEIRDFFAQLAVTMDCAKGIEGALPTTLDLRWSCWAWRNWNTTPGTIVYAQFEIAVIAPRLLKVGFVRDL